MNHAIAMQQIIPAWRGRAEYLPANETIPQTLKQTISRDVLDESGAVIGQTTEDVVADVPKSAAYATAEAGTKIVYIPESGQPVPTAAQAAAAETFLQAQKLKQAKIDELAGLDKFVSRDAEEIIAATGANVSQFIKDKIARKVTLRAEIAGL